VTALTGMNAYAALFLIPVGVSVYVATGCVVIRMYLRRYRLMH
jgi:hypothetical protein